jgi:NitT/TauT family transport system substrate-binding protein
MPHRRLSRALWGAVVALTVGIVAGPSHAADAIKIGALKSSNAGPTFIAKEKGYFAAEGLDAELVYFDAAQPIAVAVASGSVDFGTTSTSGGLFSLAGSGELRIIAGLYSEAPGFHNFAIAASLHADAGGLKTYKDLPGHSVAITQIGSPVHYSLALIADKYGLDLKSMRLLPLQSIPNMVSAIIGNQADATVINATSINPVVANGQAKLLGWIGDETPWQAAVVFATAKTIDQKPKQIEAFLRAFKKGTKDYHDAFTGPKEVRQDGPTADDVVAIIDKYTGQTPAQVKGGIAYVDADGRLDIKDIVHQVEWFKAQKMLKDDVVSESVVDKRYAVPFPGH